MNDGVTWIGAAADLLVAADLWVGLGIVVFGVLRAVQSTLRRYHPAETAVSGGISGLVIGPLVAALLALGVSVVPGSLFEGRSVGRYIAGNAPWIDWVIAAVVGLWVAGVIFTVLAAVKSSRQQDGDRQ